MENANNSSNYTNNTLKPVDDFDSPLPQISVSGILENISILLRIVATLMGLILLIWGIVYSVRIFNDVYSAIQTVTQNPTKAETMISNVSSLIGGKDLHIRVEGEDYPVDKILALLFIALGVSILTQLALGIANCGAKIIMYTSSDKEAIKKILKYTFSPAGTAPSSKNYTSDEMKKTK
ncbi:MAG: hypothetical protein AABZ60_01260 [Planctomycetota bacterium]